MPNHNKTKKNKDRSGNKLRFSVSRGRKQIFILFFLLVVQLGVLYGLTYWGYHNSRLPGSFDDFVQETGIWRIYGKKVYELTNSSEFSLDKDGEYLYFIEYIGFIESVDDNNLHLVAMDEPQVKVQVPERVEIYDCKSLAIDEISEFSETNTYVNNNYSVPLQITTHVPSQCKKEEFDLKTLEKYTPIVIKLEYRENDINKLMVFLYE